MSNHQNAIALIKAFSGQANILTIPRPFVDFMGNLDGALFLSQVLYWSDKGRDGWFYKTYAEWQEEICLSEYEVKKAVKKLIDLGVLETQVRKANGNPTVHYRLDFDAFSESFLNFLQKRKPTNSGIESRESEESLTETTTETTTEKNSPQAARPSEQTPAASSSCGGSPVELDTPGSSSKKKKDNRAELKDGCIGCPQCGELFTLEDMGDGCNCPNCHIGLVVFEVDKYGREKTIRKPSTERQPRAEFKAEPVDAFCTLVKTTCSPKQRAQWGYQLQKVAEPRGATPAQVVQAIRMIPSSEYAWHTFSNPYQDTFQSVLDVMLARLIGGIARESKPTKTTTSDPWGDSIND